MNFESILTLLFWGVFYIFDSENCLLYMFLSATFHESAHIFFYYVFNAKIDKIKILPFGISASFSSSANLSYKKENVALYSGPFFNFLLAAFFFVLSKKTRTEGAEVFILYNFAYFAVNLLPIYPLDGGRILKNFLLMRLDDEKALKISNTVTLIFLSFLFIIGIFTTVFYSNISLISVSIYLAVTFFIKPE